MICKPFLSVLALSCVLLAVAPACATTPMATQDEIIRTAVTEPSTEVRAAVALTPAAQMAAAFNDISNTLDDAAAAWSGGNIDAIMGYYDQDQAILVLIDDEPHKGPVPVQAMLEARAARAGGLGTMNYEWFEILQLDAHTAIVSGRMVISRNDAHYRGLFTRVLRRTENGWRIMHDQMALPPLA